MGNGGTCQIGDWQLKGNCTSCVRKPCMTIQDLQDSDKEACPCLSRVMHVMALNTQHGQMRKPPNDPDLNIANNAFSVVLHRVL